MKKKMNLAELRVRSFVTDLNKKAATTIRGGEEPPYQLPPIVVTPQGTNNCTPETQDCAPPEPD